MTRTTCLLLAAWLMASPVCAQAPDDPFPTPIQATEGMIPVRVVEFAALPDIGGVAARPMMLVTEPGTRRMFVNDMRGPLYSVSYDGRSVRPYVDINASMWGVRVQSEGRERGFQSFAFHPQFGQAGTPGYGRFYTLTDSENTGPRPDFTPGDGGDTHDSVLLEWTARNAAAETYDGGAPRELMRMQQPFANHNGGQLGFDPTAQPGSPEFGLLYVGFADGGSGGDPINLAQNLASPFGKIMRIDPMGRNSANGKYGIPDANPFVSDNNPNTLGEIYAYGLRNPQRFAWDSRTRNMFVADIGQNIVEKVSLVPRGGNLGWNKWEGSYRYISRAEVGLTGMRGEAGITYPIVEYGQLDPLLQPQSAVTMGYVYRGTAIPRLSNLVIFGDNPSGEIFYVSADTLPNGGQAAMRRILLNADGTPKTLLALIQEKNRQQGKTPATRADLRFGQGPDGQILLLNKGDGTIRLMTPDQP